MAEEVSNKTLVALLVVAIFVSLGGTLLSLNKLTTIRAFTGAASSSSGTAELTVATVVSVLLTGIINISGIRVNGTNAAAYGVIDTRTGAKLNITATITSPRFRIYNDGSGTRINVTMNTTKSDFSWIGGSSATADATWSQRDSADIAPGGGCIADITNTEADPGAPVSICARLPVGDSFNLTVRVTIPDNVSAGVKTNTVTVFAAATP